MMELVVATTFVSEARSKTVSTVIGVCCGFRLRLPNALRYSTLFRRPTSTTAPGTFPAAIVSCTTRSMADQSSRVFALPGTAATRLRRTSNTEMDDLMGVGGTERIDGRG